jgi:hypothetical protein
MTGVIEVTRDSIPRVGIVYEWRIDLGKTKAFVSTSDHYEGSNGLRSALKAARRWAKRLEIKIVKELLP